MSKPTQNGHSGRSDRRVALVTGGGRGIGEAIVARLVDDGLSVVVNDVDEEPVRRLVEKYGDTVAPAIGSIRDHEFPDTFLTTALDAFGRVDVVVHNAGYATYSAVDELAPADWDRVLDVLVSAPFRIMRPIGQYFRRTVDADQVSRRVISISSLAGYVGGPTQAAYGAGKAALINLSATWARELAPFNVRANAVCPGFIRTRLTEATSGDVVEIDGAEIPLTGIDLGAWTQSIAAGRVGTPDDVAGVVGLLASPRADYINGQALLVDGGVRTGF